VEASPEIAALTEALPGLLGLLGIGHMYAGKKARGAILLVCYIPFLAFLLLISLFLGSLIGVFLIFIPVHLTAALGSTYWAYKTAKKGKR
jgi:uncharacterized protein HemY